MTWQQWRDYLSHDEPPKVEVSYDEINPDDFVVGFDECMKYLEELEAGRQANAELLVEDAEQLAPEFYLPRLVSADAK